MIKNLDDWQQYYQTIKSNKIGLVPTMGHLHQGHASLLTRSLQDNDITVLSIFVNPTQFNQQSDLDNYPSSLAKDIALANVLGVDAILVPTYQQIYPDDYQFRISESLISQTMEGIHRPGHFDGMMTVIMKLLNIVKPHRIYFGEKDFQQLQLVRAMVAAFFLDVDVIACATVRDENGLALSSRNSRLSAAQRQQAAVFPQLLADANLSDQEVEQQLIQRGFIVEYIVTESNRRFGAVVLGGVRLIDNILLVNETATN